MALGAEGYYEPVVVLFSLVASHQNVDLNTVARLSTGVNALPHAFVEHGPLEGLVTLSTCNRLELYGDLPSSAEQAQASIQEILGHISAQSGLGEDFVRDSVEVHFEEEAAAHLFTVVSGLESAVVGEREISGQVRRALASAQEQGTASGELVQLFEAAARTARAVGTQTALGERGRSIVSVALDLVEEVATRPWSESRVLVFGTGAYAGATMAALAHRGCRAVEVYSASGRAQEFTDKRGGSPVGRAELAAAMSRSDVVIGCSGGAAPMSAAAMPAGPRVVVDLALTRDFDPSVADREGIELITLETVRLAAPEETVESVAAAHQIVEQATQGFRAKRSQRNVDSAIVALRQHTLQILDSEMEKVRHQYGCGAESEQLEFAMRRMVHSLLHTPMVRARELAVDGREDEFVAGLEALYGIEVFPESSAPTAEHSPAEASPAQVPQADAQSLCRHRPKAS